MVKLTLSQFGLWFFRDLSSEQRLKLFALAGLPADEIGETHGYQRVALSRCLSALQSKEAGE